MQRFRAATRQDLLGKRPVVAIDLGYSKTTKSCGVADDADLGGVNLRFGQALGRVVGQINCSKTPPLLFIEAPLSVRHCDENPAPRGRFEEKQASQSVGREWYLRGGATTTLAAIRFLRRVDQCLQELGCTSRSIPIVEAFLSNKSGPTDDKRDAVRMRGKVLAARRSRPGKPFAGVYERAESILPDLIRGVPPVIVVVGR